MHKDTLIIRFSAYDTPTQIYAVSFKSLDKSTLSDLAQGENYTVKLIEEVKLDNSANAS